MSDKTLETLVRASPGPMGCLEAIHIAAERGIALSSKTTVEVVPGRGIVGDRYFHGTGSFSRWPGSGRAISIMAAEAIEAISVEHAIDLSHGRSRRNLTTRGVDLQALIGRRFAIGSAIFRGERACAPCRYLEKLVAPGLFEIIKGRGGLRADVVKDGTISVGDSIQMLT